MDTYKPNSKGIGTLYDSLQEFFKDPTIINPTINIIKEKNYHSKLGKKVGVVLTLITTLANLVGAGCNWFTTPVENYVNTKVVLESPANNESFNTKKDKKEIDFKWGESVIYQVEKYLSERGLSKEDVGITYTLRIDNDKNMLSPEHVIETSDLEATVEVNKGTHHWQVGAKIVTEGGEEKCIYAEPEQHYTDEEMLSEIWKFIIQKIVTPTPDPTPEPVPPTPPFSKFAQFMKDVYHIGITGNYEKLNKIIGEELNLNELYKEYYEWEKKTSSSKKTSIKPDLLENKIAKLSNTKNWKASIAGHLASHQKDGERRHNAWG